MFNRRARRGISELVIILALVAVVIPIVMMLQGWLSSRVGNLENVDIVQSLSGYLISRSYTDGREVVTIGLRNQGQTTYAIQDFRALLANGTVVGGSFITVREASSGREIKPGSDRVFTIVVTTGTTRVKGIVVTASEAATNKQVEVLVSLG
ncbi:MAG: hypothetical protein RMI56_06955 [Sulfolobales archaeon]|nr:hypothetical protein [Sulfolobales archaeon]MDW8083511.1 hypothetical protein [Sulfolobales archaeon]